MLECSSTSIASSTTLSPSNTSEIADESTENLSRSSSDADKRSTCDKERGISAGVLGTDSAEKGVSGREETEITSMRSKFARRERGACGTTDAFAASADESCKDGSRVGSFAELLAGERSVDTEERCRFASDEAGSGCSTALSAGDEGDEGSNMT
jgi:hypothetical protein